MPEQLDMERFAEDVRATAPRPRPEFTERLEKRVEAGFPRQRKARFGSLRPLVPALATLLIVVGIGAPLAVIGNNSGSDDDSGGGGVVDTSGPASGESAPAPSVQPNVAPDSGSRFAPSGRRVVERRTQMELETPADEFDATTAEVLAIADRTGTIVQRSGVSESNGRGVATYDLRVPSSRLDDVLGELSGLGKVTSRSASADDITAASVAARDRLADARAERRALLRALERADTPAEADALRARLRDARQAIARAERDVRRVRARADRSRVDLTVRSTGSSGAWTPGDALDDAERVLEVTLGVLLVTAAVLAPFALLALLAAGAGRLVRRRRREAVLG